MICNSVTPLNFEITRYHEAICFNDARPLDARIEGFTATFDRPSRAIIAHKRNSRDTRVQFARNAVKGNWVFF
jgi:hypothetical protein